MKLYYAPGACSLADHIALIESKLPFTTDKVDLKARTTAEGEDYTAVNPNGYVPALGLDAGGVLTENVAILGYIADRAGNLMPQGPLGRFRALEALAYISTELHKSFAPFFKPGSSDEAKSAAKTQLGKRFGLFEDALASQEFALGDQFGVADCYLFVMLFWAREKVGLDLPPHLSSYYERLSQRAAILQALAEEGLGA